MSCARIRSLPVGPSCHGATHPRIHTIAPSFASAFGHPPKPLTHHVDFAEFMSCLSKGDRSCLLSSSHIDGIRARFIDTGRKEVELVRYSLNVMVTDDGSFFVTVTVDVQLLQHPFEFSASSKSLSSTIRMMALLCHYRQKHFRSKYGSTGPPSKQAKL